MSWPVLKRYADAPALALPLGGIGTGTVSLGARGDLRDWEIGNRPAKGFMPQHTFFALRSQRRGAAPVTRVLEGALRPPYHGPMGATTPNHGLPRFRKSFFSAAYPLGQVHLSDRDVGLDVRIEAFNPLVPGDAEASGLPIAVLRFVLRNRLDVPVSASVCGNVQNVVGDDGTAALASGNHNEVRIGRGIRGLYLSTDGVDTSAESFGSIALATTARQASMRTGWLKAGWGTPLLDFWDDFAADGKLDERDPEDQARPMASLATSVVVAPGGERAVTFLLAWHFPNRYGWGQEPVGNWYTTRYDDAWDVASAVAPRLKSLEARTLTFVNAVVDSDLPLDVKDAALSNLTGLRSQTSFRTSTGQLFGWEGCHDRAGCCHGSCTHVWNYELATPMLFGDLARSMREVEFAYATASNGHMTFRVGLPLAEYDGGSLAAADGQMGCLVKLYRDWQLSGDDDFLRRLWPQAKRALEFCWIPGGWDADRDGVMEGCQHNTMDVEYYGPNPQMGMWYLAALHAASRMAAHVGDDDFAGECTSLAARGSTWIDENLFNGEYYEHQIWPATDVASGLRHASMGAKDPLNPDLQLGPGCLVDQLVGQMLADVCGLGALVDRKHIKTTLRAIMRHNFRTNFHDHMNPMRSYALGDESALLMATYPRGQRPLHPFPYFGEVMTGFEYTAAVGMLYEGQIKDGLRCISAVRDRHDGVARSPFDEAECGHHYARAMASWGALLALTGFHWSAVDGVLEFAAATKRATWFWSNGSAWGTVTQTPRRGVDLRVHEGRLAIRRLRLAGAGEVEFTPARVVTPSRPLTARVT